MGDPNVGEPVTVWGEDGIGVSLHRDYGRLVVKAGPGATLTPAAWEKVRAEGDRLIAEAGAVEAARLALEAGDVPSERTVTIPASDQHEGFHSMKVTLPWACPQCGGPRGEPYRTISYDGSRRLGCDGWDNPCGHVDYYSAVRQEARALAGRGTGGVR